MENVSEFVKLFVDFSSLEKEGKSYRNGNPEKFFIQLVMTVSFSGRQEQTKKCVI